MSLLEQALVNAGGKCLRFLRSQRKFKGIYAVYCNMNYCMKYTSVSHYICVISPVSPCACLNTVQALVNAGGIHRNIQQCEKLLNIYTNDMDRYLDFYIFFKYLFTSITMCMS